ncbi:MAG TPA: hypothetical protein P5136_02665 [Methanofastidiosum sp.]|nr:hypothetical protein [Methanofastidiosum sp.]
MKKMSIGAKFNLFISMSIAFGLWASEHLKIMFTKLKIRIETKWKAIQWKKHFTTFLDILKKVYPITTIALLIIIIILMVTLLFRVGSVKPKPTQPLFFNTEQSRLMLEPLPNYEGKEPQFQLTILSLRGETYVVTILSKKDVVDILKFIQVYKDTTVVNPIIGAGQ